MIGGLRVHYEMQGQGETVVLLHGWASSLQPYRRLMDQLSSKYRVIALDFPGMGRSEEPKEPWDVDGFADFVLAFLEQFEVKKLSLVGQSYGGRVIIKLANRKLPFAIDKIVLIDSAGIKPPAEADAKAVSQCPGKAAGEIRICGLCRCQPHDAPMSGQGGE